MEFEWDEAKNRANLLKHGIAFEDAIEVFDDPRGVTDDGKMAGGEMRFQTIGQVARATLFVVHTPRAGNDGTVRTRLISARFASREERGVYERG